MTRYPTKRKRTRRTRGAGYGFQFSGSTPGILTVQPYSGTGKDCAAAPTTIGSFGLPGLTLKGGSRRHRRRHGGSYGFTARSADLMASAPFERMGCHGMRGGANNNNSAYYASTAGYGTEPVVIPGGAGAGFLRTVAYPGGSFSPSCMRGGSRRKRTRRHRNRRHR